MESERNQGIAQGKLLSMDEGVAFENLKEEEDEEWKFACTQKQAQTNLLFETDHQKIILPKWPFRNSDRRSWIIKQDINRSTSERWNFPRKMHFYCPLRVYF